MSEYQYYEFRMVDRSLTKDELTEIRKISTRAELTSTSFKNFYTFGDFKGKPLEMMLRWYDAQVYTANWGSHVLMLAFPRALLDLAVAERYLVNDWEGFQVKDDRVVIIFASNPEDGGWYGAEAMNDDWLDHLIPIRADLAQQDYRALYLGWLFGVQEEYGFGYVEADGDRDEVDEYDIEPPVPPGLCQLTEPLKALVEFLRIDQDLLDVAAERSADLNLSGPSDSDLRGWLQTLPVATKDAIILRVLAGEGMGLRLELLHRYRESTTAEPAASPAGRKIGDLLRSAETRATERKCQEAERAAKEQARKELEAAKARAAYLDDLFRRGDQLWNRVEAYVETKQPRSYAEAVTLMTNLRDASEFHHKTDDYDERVTDLRRRHAKKSSFLERLDDVGL